MESIWRQQCVNFNIFACHKQVMRATDENMELETWLVYVGKTAYCSNGITPGCGS